MMPVKIVMSDDATTVYSFLRSRSDENKLERMLLNAVDAKLLAVVGNPYFGDNIPKKLFPEEYLRRYGVTNLFRVPLPQYWRLLYTLQRGVVPNQTVAFVLDIIDHKTYDKKFNYRKS